MADTQNNLIVDMVKDLKKDNKTEHSDLKKEIKEIVKNQKITNGNITKIKTKQLYLRGILIGAGIVLFVLGLLPDRLFQIVRLAF